MRTVRRVFAAAVLVAAAVGLSGCSYNRFVSQDEAIKAQWAQVENQLQRRNDLIPNLVETVRGTAQQEQSVFGQIADSRAKLAGAKTPQETINAANEQTAALARLLVVVENYPQLRSNDSFNRLMDELSGTENRLAVERMRTTSGCRSTTRCGGGFRRTLRRASSDSRTIRTSTRRPPHSSCRAWISARWVASSLRPHGRRPHSPDNRSRTWQ
jgi:LemA protein